MRDFNGNGATSGPSRWYLDNYWYVAATAQELTSALQQRMVCGQPLVLYRRPSDGRPVALDDRCPHRRYALSRGTLIGDEIECGYHGLRFASSGACTFIPCQTRIAPGFGARAYPVVERYKLIWVWIGDGEPDESLIPSELAMNDAPDWALVSGMKTFPAHYMLALDNSLDMTHTVFVHKSTLASRQLVLTPNKVEMGTDTFRSGRVLEDVDTPPMVRAVTGLPEKSDRSLFTTFLLPGILVGDFRQSPAGALGGPQEYRTFMNAYFTPETERSTHFFWSQARSFAIDDTEVSRVATRMLEQAFDEDRAVLAEQQRLIDLDGGVDRVRLVNLAGDNACLAARRLIQRRLDQQRAGSSSAAARPHQ